jgi:hypothetical protein
MRIAGFLRIAQDVACLLYDRGGMASMKPRCCVVVCYWTGRHPRALFKLLRQMQAIPAGEPFDVLIVANGGDQRPFVLPAGFESLNIHVLNRANQGWNLGAWDAGWRHASGYEHYLFLQAECELKMTGWVARFARRMDIDPGIGLLGERLMWQNMTWAYVRDATEMDLKELGRPIPEGLLESIATYHRLLSEHGIDPGELGTHLVSVILFTKREVLERVDGILHLGDAYAEAVASEVGTSRRVANAGYRLSQIADEPFSRIGHPQWAKRSRLTLLLERVQGKLDRMSGWR